MDRSDVIITIWDRTILIKEKTNLVSCIVSSYFIQFKRIRVNTIQSLLNCNTCSVALLCLWISLYIVDPAFLCACKGTVKSIGVTLTELFAAPITRYMPSSISL